jgi:signal transduction histidine kinase
LNHDDGGALTARVAELEEDLAAKSKTIDVLMSRVDGAPTRQADAFALFKQNVTLEGAVADRTRELREKGEELALALDELKRMQSQLVQAQRLEGIGSLAAGVAHEINTPIQYVTDNVTFLSKSVALLTNMSKAVTAVLDAADCAGMPEVEALRRAVDRRKLEFVLSQAPSALHHAREGLERIASIVVAMKEFAHPGSEEKVLVDLARAIETTLTVARSEWKYVATVETSFDPGVPPVLALRNELNQVFLNIIVNAAQAIEGVVGGRLDEKGTIRVTTRVQGPFAVVEVSDTGGGIPADIRARIFDPFFTTKPVGKGTGQGLAIAYNVVVAHHGGRIDVRSEVGVGTSFEISLPIDGVARPVSLRPGKST